MFKCLKLRSQYSNDKFRCVLSGKNPKSITCTKNNNTHAKCALIYNDNHPLIYHTYIVLKKLLQLGNQ